MIKKGGSIWRPCWGHQTWPYNLSNVRKEIGMGNDIILVEIKDWTGSYTMNGNDITVSYDSHSFTGTFDGKNLNVSISGIQLVFKKQ